MTAALTKSLEGFHARAERADRYRGSQVCLRPSNL